MKNRSLVAITLSVVFGLACGGGASATPQPPAPTVEASTPPAPAEPKPAVEVAPEAPAKPAGGTHVGVLSKARHGVLTLSTKSGDSPPVGTRADLSKEVKQKVFGMDVVAWVGIAEVEVTEVTKHTVVCKILEETSEIEINGKKKNMFEPGAPTQLVWPAG